MTRQGRLRYCGSTQALAGKYVGVLVQNISCDYSQYYPFFCQSYLEFFTICIAFILEGPLLCLFHIDYIKDLMHTVYKMRMCNC